MTHCVECGSTAAKMRCSACKYAIYCDEKCQAKNFHKHHKRICLSIEDNEVTSKIPIPNRILEITQGVDLLNKYIVVDRVIDVICASNEEPSIPNVTFVNIPSPTNATSAASCWRTFNLYDKIVYLDEIGNTIPLKSITKEQLADNINKKFGVIGKDILIPPSIFYFYFMDVGKKNNFVFFNIGKGQFKIINIQEIRLTLENQVTAKINSRGEKTIDSAFEVYRRVGIPKNYVYWINRSQTVEQSILLSLGPVIVVV